MKMEPLAFIALGSNQGDSRQTLSQAMDRLQNLSKEPLLRSSLWKTSPVDCPPGSPPFMNAVVGLRPREGETPETILSQLQSLEREFGRGPRTAVNEPRVLDLDLLAVGAHTRQTEALRLPHPRAHQRRFVLAPLAEIAPDFVIPGQTQPVHVLLDDLDSSEVVLKLSPRPRTS
jgi:2-amino-4-hydroxy-6-hydroxymethyldihydropteridine diphosphokinase